LRRPEPRAFEAAADGVVRLRGPTQSTMITAPQPTTEAAAARSGASSENWVPARWYPTCRSSSSSQHLPYTTYRLPRLSPPPALALLRWSPPTSKGARAAVQRCGGGVPSILPLPRRIPCSLSLVPCALPLPRVPRVTLFSFRQLIPATHSGDAASPGFDTLARGE
jgi:hypothetical protein